MVSVDGIQHGFDMDGDASRWVRVERGQLPWPSPWAAILVSITSEEEDSWVYGNVDGDGRWIGGWQDINDPDYSEPGGGWKWLTGEEWIGIFIHPTGMAASGPDNNGH